MRGFSDAERDRIREELVETGRELLLTYGPEKTTVADVTEPVGIAKSTFYRFFDSKGELYLEIYRREQKSFFERAEEKRGDFEDARAGLEWLFRIYIDYVEESPLVQRMVVEGEYDRVFRDLDRDKLAEVEREAVERLLPFFEDLRQQTGGRLRELDVPTVFGLMSVFGLLAIHRDQYEDYDDDFYQQIRDELVTVLALGLTAKENP